MEDVVYEGRRLRAKAFPVPDGAFGVKILIWSSPDATSWCRMSILPGSWNTVAEAEREAIARGRSAIDGEINEAAQQ